MREKIPKALMVELCAKVDTIGAVEHVAECYDLGAGARGSILFCEGQRKAARLAARQQA